MDHGVYITNSTTMTICVAWLHGVLMVKTLDL